LERQLACHVRSDAAADRQVCPQPGPLAPNEQTSMSAVLWSDSCQKLTLAKSSDAPWCCEKLMSKRRRSRRLRKWSRHHQVDRFLCEPAVSEELRFADTITESDAPLNRQTKQETLPPSGTLRWPGVPFSRRNSAKAFESTSAAIQAIRISAPVVSIQRRRT
jgi:hypothetical protein